MASGDRDAKNERPPREASAEVDVPSYSDPPVESTPPTGRIKRDTPPARPHGRRASRTSSDPPPLGERRSSMPPALEGAAARSTVVLWGVIVALSGALAWALLR